MHFRFNLANIATGVSKHVRDGVAYVVAPVVMCREMVLNGELVPMKVLQDSLGPTDSGLGPQGLAGLWEGLPVTLAHPEDETLPVGQTLAWLKEQQVGFVENARMAGKDLVAEIWLPVEQKDPLAAETVQRIAAGELVEVSIGSWSITTPQEGVFDGKPYKGITDEISPNHLALLPNDRGACSVAAGCGTPRLSTAMQSVRNAARRPASKGVESTPWSVSGRSLSDWATAAAKATGATFDATAPVKEWPVEVRAWIADRTLLGSVNAETAEELLFFPVVNPNTGALNRGALMAVLGGRAHLAPATDSQKASARRMALELLEEAFGLPSSNAAIQRKDAAAMEAPCGCKKSQAVQVTFQVNGARVAAVVAEALKATGMAADKLAARVAAAIDKPQAEVAAILRGERDVIPDEFIKAIADVLGISSGLLYAVADEDLREFLRKLEQDKGSQASASGFSLKGLMQGLFGKFTRALNGGVEDAMKEKIEQLKAKYNLSDEQTEALAKMPEAMVDSMAAQLAADSSANAEPKTEPKQQPLGAAVKLTWDEIQAAMPDDMRQRLARIDAAEKNERAELVAVLKGRNLGLTEEQLKGMGMDALKGLKEGTDPKEGAGGLFVGAQGVAPQGFSKDDAATDPGSLTPSPYAQFVAK